MPVASRPVLDSGTKSEMPGGIEGPHEEMRLLHDEAEVLQPRARTFLHDQVMRILLSVQKRTDDALAEARVTRHTESATRVERQCARHIWHHKLKMVHAQRGGSLLFVRSRVCRLECHARTKF